MSGTNIVPRSNPARNGQRSQRLDNLKKLVASVRLALTGSTDPDNDPIEKLQNALRDVMTESQR